MKIVVAAVVFLATAPAFAGLALEVEVEKAEVAFEAPVTFVIRFVNRGPEEVRYFEPLHVGSLTFPAVRLVPGGGGQELRPYDSPFQSMVSRGLQGAIIRLGPGEKKEYRHVRARFLAVDRNTQRADWYEPRPLPDGEYEVRAEYFRKDNLLSWNTGGFNIEKRPAMGIFVGKIRSAPVTLRVGPPSKPHVRISVPERGTTEVSIAFANPTAKQITFAGVARFELGSKMYGGVSGQLGDGKLTVTVPAGGRVERRVDLRSLDWYRDRPAGGGPLGLGEHVPQGVCHLRFVMSGEVPIASDGVWVQVPPVPSRGLEHLAVTAVLSPSGPIHAGEPLTVTVRVENRGEAESVLVRRLSFPKELLLGIEDATGVRASISSTTGKASSSLDSLRPRGADVCKLARGLSWDRDRFDLPPGLTADDFVRVKPGAAVLREIEISSRLAKGLTPGRYLIRAGYRNPESGRRFGFPEDRLAPTGIVWSAPVELVVE